MWSYIIFCPIIYLWTYILDEDIFSISRIVTVLYQRNTLKFHLSISSYKSGGLLPKAATGTPIIATNLQIAGQELDIFVR